ncbi:hypothetical protein JW835_02165 [bacterium]|nr:hypothetical protein [bacterium]
MKKTFKATCLFILCLVMAMPVLATETRVGSMGGIGYYIRDNSNIFYFPGTLMQYKNQAVAELRAKNNDDLYTIGFHMSSSSSSVFGAYLNRPLNLPQDILGSVTPSLSLDRCASVFYGGQLSSINYGIIFSIAMDKEEEDTGSNDVKESASYFGLTAGASTDDADLGLTIEFPSASYEMGSSDKTWGGLGLGLNGRYFSQQTAEMEVVLLGTFYYGFAKQEQGSSEIDYTRLQLGLGAGINYQATKNNMLVLALEAFGLDMDKSAVEDGDETTETTTTLPGIYIGVESKIKPWFIARLGARQVYESYKEATDPEYGDDTEDTDFRSSFGVTFGLGIVMGGLELDALFNEGILFDGPNVISGQTNTLANRISLTYHFGRKGE